jgi:RNA polymerase sigma-70 factor, ECF subfamily
MAAKDLRNEPRSAERSSSTSTSLLDRAKARDPEAWRKLVQLYGPLVYGWCRRWRIDPDDAADVVQEVFWAVTKAIGRFSRSEPGATFRGWLWTIARTEARNYYAARGKRPQAVGGTDLQARLAQVPELLDEASDDTPPAGEAAVCLRRALEMIQGDFQAQTWQAFWRVTVGGQPAADVARDLGMTRDAVRQAKHRVVARLREEFGSTLG